MSTTISRSLNGCAETLSKVDIIDTCIKTWLSRGHPPESPTLQESAAKCAEESRKAGLVVWPCQATALHLCRNVVNDKVVKNRSIMYYWRSMYVLVKRCLFRGVPPPSLGVFSPCVSI